MNVTNVLMIFYLLFTIITVRLTDNDNDDNHSNNSNKNDKRVLDICVILHLFVETGLIVVSVFICCLCCYLFQQAMVRTRWIWCDTCSSLSYCLLGILSNNNLLTIMISLWISLLKIFRHRIGPLLQYRVSHL